MISKNNETKGVVAVFEIRLPEYSAQLQEHLFGTLFTDRCSNCTLPSYIEIESPPRIDFPDLKQEVGLACGFWLARKDIAQTLCANFESQFGMRTISDNASFLILKNLLISVDPFYTDDIGHDPSVYLRARERICSLCGRPYVFMYKGFTKFKGGNVIKPRTIYETSLKFGQGDVKYPRYFCDEEAAYALRGISRTFKFVRSAAKFSVGAV